MEGNFSGISFEDKYGEEARVNPDLRRALEFLEKAGQAHRTREIEQAIELYKESIAFYPTADAHTYLAWMYSLQGRFEEAIEECHRAIELDEDFGNPYNDIGCYLLELGEEDESIHWFERAKRARRYEPRHFPYLNLGRVYVGRGRHGKGLAELYQALRITPKEDSIRRRVVELVTLLG